MTTEQKRLCDWLTGHGHVDVLPLRVTIGAEAWDGASYTTVHTWSSAQDAVRWGKAKAGDTYRTQHVICLGKLPKVWTEAKRTREGEKRVCFPNGVREWYVAAYGQNVDPKFKKSHPFGDTFILGPWDVPGGEAIDKYSSKPYVRVPMTVELV